jgi:hypothetical protein
MPSVFTNSLLDSNIDYNPWSSNAKTLFNSRTEYVGPERFNYELPKNGIPEFAFIGRLIVILNLSIHVSLKQHLIIEINITDQMLVNLV